MYKTIRHGENSLQYTILPQNDDFRMEGKLSSAGSSCSNNGKSRKSKVKRHRRRSFFAYLGLIFVCTVIVGAILIPFLVSAECLPNPTKWFLKTKTALIRQGNSKETSITNSPVVVNNHRATGSIVKEKPLTGDDKEVGHTGVGKNKSSLNEVESKLPLLGKNQSNTLHQSIQDNSQPYQQSANITDTAISVAKEATAVTEITSGKQSGRSYYIVQQHDGDVILNSVSEGKNSSPIPAQNSAVEQHLNNSQNIIHTFSTTDRASNAELNSTVPTITSTIQQKQQQQQEHLNSNQTTAYSALLHPALSALPNAANINSPRLLGSNNFGSPAAAQPSPTITTRIIQVPLLKATAKKPIIPPASAKTNSLPPHVDHSDVNGAFAIVKPAGSQPSVNASSSSSSLPSPVANRMPSNSASPPTTKFAIAKPDTGIKSDWIQAHWPYIDPSTYFQWTGYKAEDSVLLPALLGFALIGVILIVAVCLVARNKRTIVSSVRKRNRNDIEETGAEDNATLLTTTNLSDED